MESSQQQQWPQSGGTSSGKGYRTMIDNGYGFDVSKNNQGAPLEGLCTIEVLAQGVKAVAPAAAKPRAGVPILDCVKLQVYECVKLQVYAGYGVLSTTDRYRIHEWRLGELAGDLPDGVYLIHAQALVGWSRQFTAAQKRGGDVVVFELEEGVRVKLSTAYGENILNLEGGDYLPLERLFPTEVALDGKEFQAFNVAAYNPFYLADFAKAATSRQEPMIMKWTTSGKPVTVLVEERFRGLLMPFRFRN